jgi:hypothetical protein
MEQEQAQAQRERQPVEAQPKQQQAPDTPGSVDSAL